MSQLLEAQQKFFVMSNKLDNWLIANGYSCTFGETLRTKAQAEQNAKTGAGISNSLHLIKLARDLAIWQGDKQCLTYEDFLPIGVFWESIGGSWGGRFKNQDCDHFSLSYGGVR